MRQNMGAVFGKCLGQGKDKNGEQQQYRFAKSSFAVKNPTIVTKAKLTHQVGRMNHLRIPLFHRANAHYLDDSACVLTPTPLVMVSVKNTIFCEILYYIPEKMLVKILLLLF